VAASDHLNDAQFRVHAGKYAIQEEGFRAVVARRLDPQGNPGRRAGYLSYFGGHIDRNEDGTPNDRSNINGGLIYKTYVSGPHRRKGLATAMLDYAREKHPDMEIRHSNALSDDGRAWRAAEERRGNSGQR
jgi:GNAT superfamily N-acetyltransferase